MKMVAEYITPEGKFDVVLFGKSGFNDVTKKATKEFVTNDDGIFSTAKSPVGMFANIYIPNDLGYVVKRATEYYVDGIEEESEIVKEEDEVLEDVVNTDQEADNSNV